MTISFSGLASGLDTSSWVESLVALKKAKVTSLQEQKSDIEYTRDAVSEIKVFFNNFRSALEKVTDAKFSAASIDIFVQNIATSSDMDVFTALASTDAVEGSYRIAVEQLATYSAAYSDYTTTQTVTTVATGSSTLTSLGAVIDGAATLGITVNGVQRGMTITEFETLDSFISKLQGLGVEAYYNEDSGIFSVNLDLGAIDDVDNTGIIAALQLDQVNEGYQSGTWQTEETRDEIVVADLTTKLCQLGRGQSVSGEVIVRNSNGVQDSFFVNNNTSIGEFIANLQDMGLYANFTSDGILEISGGNIIGGSFDAISFFGLEEDPVSAMVTGNELTTTIIIPNKVELTTKLVEDLGVSKGYFEITNPDGDKYYEKIYSGMTISDLITDFGNLGISASLDAENGILTITGGSFETLTDWEVQSLCDENRITEPDVDDRKGTNLLNCLGLNVDANITVSSTRAKSRAMTYSKTAAIEDSDVISNFIDMPSNKEIQIHAYTGEVIGTYNVTNDTTFEELFSELSLYGIDGDIHDGVVLFTSDDNKYLTGDVLTAMGVGVSYVTTTVTTSVGTQQSTELKNYTETDIATADNKITDFGIAAGKVLNVKDRDGYIIGSYTTNANTTFADLFNKIAEWGMDGDLNEGVVTFVHDDGGYVDGSLATALGVQTSYNTVTTTRTVGSTTSGTILQKFTTTDLATGDNKLSDFIDANGKVLNVKDRDGNIIGSFTATNATTFADLFNAIAPWGMDGDLNEGVVTFVHDFDGYVDGSLATALGVSTTYNTVTTTRTVGSTTSGTIVQKYTSNSIATDQSMVADFLGEDSYDITIHYMEENTFINEVNRRNTTNLTALSAKSESTSITGGTYKISTSAELQQLARMSGNGKITGGTFVLADDIDLQGINWTPISRNFSGTFDGNGYTISNLTISSDAQDIGLFGSLSGTIKNVNIEDARIECFGISQFTKNVAILAGRSTGRIENCSVSGTINRKYGGDVHAGGIVAQMNIGSVSYCKSDVNIINATESGGIAGYMGGGTISYCKTSGDITALEDAGGIVGLLSNGTVTDSYSTAGCSVSCCNFGGIAGYTDNSATFTNCMYSGNIGSGNSRGSIVGYSNDGFDAVSCAATGDAPYVGDGSYNGTISTISEGEFIQQIDNFTKTRVLSFDVDDDEGTFGEIAAQLAEYGIDMDVEDGRVTFIGNNGQWVTGSFIDALGVSTTYNTVTTTRTVGSTTSGTIVQKYTSTDLATGDNKLSDFIAANGKVLNVKDRDGNIIGSFTATNATTFADLFNAIAPWGMDGDLNEGVVTFVHDFDGYVDGSLATALGVSTTYNTVTTTRTVGSTTSGTIVQKYTSTDLATGDNKLSDFIAANGKVLNVKDRDGNIIGSFTATNATTFADLFNAIAPWGMDGDLNEGVVTFVHDFDGYVDGSLATALGVSTTYNTVTTTRTVGSTTSGTIVQKYTSTDLATGDNKLSDFIAANGKVLNVKDRDGNIIGSFTATNATTFADLFNAIAPWGMDGDLNEGVVTFVHDFDGYVDGTLATALGVSTTYNTVTTTRTVGSTTSGTIVQKYTSTDLATGDNKLSDFIAANGKVLNVKDRDGNIIGSFTATNATTFADLFNAIAPWGMDGDLNEGVVTFVHDFDGYVDGTLATALGVSTTYNTVTTTRTVGSTTSGTIVQKYTSTDLATGDNKLSDFIDANGKVLNVKDRDGNIVGSFTATNATTFADLFNAIAPWGMDGDLNEGVVTFVHDFDGYVDGTLATALGVSTTYNTVTTTRTVGSTTSGTIVQKYTTDTIATDQSQIGDFLEEGDYEILVHSMEENKFIDNDFERTDTASMTALADIDEETTISSGSYKISTASELQQLARMTNNGYITGGTFILANDIDLQGIDWNPIGWHESSFKGNFNGNGYTISNLTCQLNSSSEAGLFGHCSNSTIENVNIENANIIHYGTGAAGILAGNVTGIIKNCSTSGTVLRNASASSSSGANAGGLVGTLSGTISSCKTDANITNGYTVGGLAGNLTGSSNINNCVAKGTLTGSALNMGGFVGSITGSFGQMRATNLFASVNIDCNAVNCGGFAGNIGRTAYPAYTLQASFTSCSASGTVVNAGVNTGSFAGTVASSKTTVTSCSTTGTAPYVGDGSFASGTVSTISDGEFTQKWDDLTKTRTTWVSGDDTFGCVASDLAQYGIDMDVEDGRVTFIGNDGQWVSGSFIDALGVTTTYNTVTETRTVGGNSTGTIHRYTTDTIATDQSVIGDFLGEIDDEITIHSTEDNTFINEVDRINTTNMTALSAKSESTTISSGSYKISTSAELQQLARMTNNGYITGGRFVLADNIDLQGIDWNPIGTYTSGFNGTFNGNGYTISNLTIDSDAQYVGLFGYIKNYTVIKNVNVENTSIISSGDNANVGILVGNSAAFSTIENCSTSGTIVAKDNTGNVGGLVGSTGYQSQIKYCKVDANISGGKNTGGLVGKTTRVDVISSCVASGTISGTGESYGGFIGRTGDGGGEFTTIRNSYTSVNLDCNAGRCGGFVGYAYGRSGWNSAVFTSCVSSGTVVNSGGVKGSFAGVVSTYDGTSTTVTACYTTGTAPYVGDGSFASGTVSTITDGQFAEMRDALTKTRTIWGVSGEETFGELAAQLAEYGIDMDVEDGVVTFIGNNGQWVTGSFIDALGVTTETHTITETRTVGTNSSGTVHQYETESIATDQSLIEDFLGGDIYTLTIHNTEENTFINNGIDVYRTNTTNMTALSAKSESTTISSGSYKISTSAELQQLARMTNNGYITGGTFVLADNVDLQGIDWNPIGTDSTHAFKGTFDGNGYTISNLTIDSDAQYVGLFGYSTGTIKNVNTENASVISEYTGGYSYEACIGILAGYSSGSINNCSVSGTVDIGDNIGKAGGLGGYISGNIVCCKSDAIISGGQITGGLVGVFNGDNKLFNSCTATGTISGTGSKYGGLVGSMVERTGGLAISITNSYTSVDIDCNAQYCGGFMGGCGAPMRVVLKNCLASGTIDNAGANTGSFAGSIQSTSTTVTSCSTTGTAPFVGAGSFATGTVSTISDGEFTQKWDDLTKTTTYEFDTIDEWTFGGIAAWIAPFGVDMDVEDGVVTFIGNDGQWVSGSFVDALGVTTETHTITETRTVGGNTTGTVHQYTTESIATDQSLIGDFITINNSNNVLELNGAGNLGLMVAVVHRDTSSMTAMSNVDESSSISSGTYKISTTEELEKLSRMVNNNKVGSSCEFVLANNINMSEIADFGMIGNDDYFFTATFDGNGYTVSNVNIVANGSDDFSAGFFGYITHGATIRNLNVQDIYISNTNYYNQNTGGLAGFACDGFTIDNCSVSGYLELVDHGSAINAAGFIGNIGTCDITQNITQSITNCRSDVNIYCEYANQIGGFVGETYNCIISNCYAKGSIDSDSVSNCAGGFIAETDSGVTVNNSATEVSMDVNGYTHFAKFVGLDTGGAYNTCYSASTLTYSDDPYAGDNNIGTTATIEQIQTALPQLFNTSIAVSADMTFGELAAQLAGYGIDMDVEDGVVTFIGNDGQWVSGSFIDALGVTTETHTITETRTVGTNTAGTVHQYETETIATDQSIICDFLDMDTYDLTIHTNEEKTFIGTFTVINTSTMTALSAKSESTTISSGSYKISTSAELEQFARMTNNGKITGGTFVLADDIDLQGINWTPISSSGVSFHGCFNGNGYTISNLSINADNTSGYAGCGLFGYVENAEIKNVNIENANIYFQGTTVGGILAGEVDIYTTIYNCSTSGNIYLEDSGVGSDVGGLIGRAGIDVGISCCKSNVNISGCNSAYSNAGGLIGYTREMITIVSCATSGTISSGNGCYGGLIGYADSATAVMDTYASVDINSSGTCGGFIGYLDDGRFGNCSSSGTVHGADGYTGSLIGVLNENLFGNSGTTGTAPFVGDGSYTGTVSTITGGQFAEMMGGLVNEQFVFNGIDADGTTFGTLAAQLAEYGVDMDVEDGYVTFISNDGKWVSGSFIDALGIGTYSYTQTVEGTATVAVAANAVVTCLTATTMPVNATRDTVISDTLYFNDPSNNPIRRIKNAWEGDGTVLASTTLIETFDSKIFVKNNANEKIGTVSVTTSMTFGQLFDALDNYGIQGIISDGVMSFTSNNGNYLDDNTSKTPPSVALDPRTLTEITTPARATTGILTYLGMEGMSVTVSNPYGAPLSHYKPYVQISQTITVQATMTSSAAVSYTTIADESSKIADFAGDDLEEWLDVTIAVSETTELMNNVNRIDTSNLTAVSSLTESTSYTSGTYKISTTDELCKLSRMVNNGKFNSTSVTFVLANDIDMTGVDWTFIGENTGYQSSCFRSIFDGNGYKITNLSMQAKPVSGGNIHFGAALFGTIWGGTVKNLNVEDIDIHIQDTDFLYSYAGGIAESVAGGGKISNCKVSGDIVVDDFARYSAGQNGQIWAGGIAAIVGQQSGNTIENCISDVNITGAQYSGGIAGISLGNTQSTIKNCRTTGEITSNQDTIAMGGIIGLAEGTITVEKCTSDAMLIEGNGGGSIGGGIAGQCTSYNDKAQFISCLADCTMTGLNEKGGIVGVLWNSDESVLVQYCKTSASSLVGIGYVYNPNSNYTNQTAATIAAAATSMSLYASGTATDYHNHTLSTDATFGDLFALCASYGQTAYFDSDHIFRMETVNGFVPPSSSIFSNCYGSTISATRTIGNDTTFSELGLSVYKTITVQDYNQVGQNISTTSHYITVRPDNTVGELIDRLSAHGIDAFVDINDGKFKIVGNNNTGGYISSIDSNIRTALKLGSNYNTTTTKTTCANVNSGNIRVAGEGYVESTITTTATQTLTIVTESTRTITANDTSDRQTGTVTTTMTGTTTLGQLGLGSGSLVSGTISGYDHGQAFTVGLFADTTIDGIIGMLGAHGIEASVHNGRMTFKGSNNGYITDATGSAVNLGAAAAYTTAEVTEITGSNSAGTQQSANVTVNMTGTTTLGDLNLGNGTISGYYHGQAFTISLFADTTVDSIIGMLGAHGIEASVHNGRMTFEGSNNGYITAATGSAVNLGAAAAYASSQVTEITGSNSAGTQQSANVTVNMTGTTTLGDLNLGNGTISGYYHGQAFTVSLFADTTIDSIIGMLGAHGIEASVHNGRMTFKGSNNGYITAATGSAVNLGASAAYASAQVTEITGSNSGGDYQSKTVTTTMNGTTTLGDLNLGNGTISGYDHDQAFTVSLFADTTIDSIIGMLGAHGIEASVHNGRMTFEGSNYSYISAVSGSAVNLGAAAAYSSAQITEITGTNSGGTQQSATVTTTMTGTTTLGDLNLGEGTITGYYHDQEFTVNLHADTTIDGIIGMLGAHGIEASVHDGLMTFEGTNSGYISGATGSATVLGAKTATVQSSTTVVEGTNSAGQQKSRTVTTTMTGTTTLGDLNLGEGTITGYYHDQEFTVNLHADTTIDGIIGMLGAHGIEASVHDGLMTFEGTNSGYISGATGSATVLGAKTATVQSSTTVVEGTNSAGQQKSRTVTTTMTGTTTLGDLNLGEGTITGYYHDQEFTVNLHADTTIDGIIGMLGAHGIEASVHDGLMTFEGTNSGYISGATGSATVLGAKTATVQSSTTVVEGTNSAGQQKSRTVTTTMTGTTTLGDLNLGEGTITGYYHDQEFTVNLHADTTIDGIIGMLGAHGIEASVHDGLMTFEGTNSGYISGATGSATVLGAKTATVQSSTTVVEGTNSAGQQKSRTVTTTMTGTTTLGDLNLGEGTITGYYHDQEFTVNLHADTTIDGIIGMLGAHGIEASVHDGLMTFEGTNSGYISGATGSATVLGAKTATVQSSTTVVEGTNSAGQQKSRTVTTTMTGTTTLGDLNLGEGTITGYYHDQEFTVNLHADTTIDGIIGMLGAHGIEASVHDGLMTFEGTNSGYISGATGSATVLGAKTATVQSSTTVVEGTNSAGQQKSRTVTTTMTGTTTLGDLNLGEGTITGYYHDQEFTVNLHADTTIDGIIGMLGAHGIEASVHDGLMTFEGTNSGYISGATGSATVLGARTATVKSSTTVVEGTNSAGDQKSRTITALMNGTTTLEQLGLGEGTISLNYDGEDYTITINSETTIDSLIAQLASYGIRAYINNGVLVFEGSTNGYITGATGSAVVLGAGCATVQTTTTIVEGTNTAGTYKARTLTFNMDGTTTFAQLGLGAGTATVQYGDGVRTISMTANNTMNDFLTALAGVGITGSIANGVMTLEGTYDGMILGTTGGINGLGINAAYTTTEVTTTYGSDSTSTYLERTTNPTMLRSTKLKDLQDTDGNNLGITTGSYYVYSNGVRTVETIEDDTTVEDFMSTMAKHGLISEYDSDGAISVSGYNNTYLETSSLMGANSNVVEQLFNVWDFTRIYDTNHLEIPTPVVEAISRDTKLADIAEGEYQSGAVSIIKNGVTTNLMLTDDDTVGTFLDEIAMFGFESVINDSGQIIIRNTGDGVLREYTGADQASNILDIIGAQTDDWVLTKSYDSTTQNVITETVIMHNATEATRLSELSADYAGNIELYIDGTRSIIEVAADETVGTLLQKFRSLGLEASIADGKVTIQSGFKLLSINAKGTEGSLSTSSLASADPNSVLRLQFQEDLGNYLASSNAVESTYTEDLVLSVSKDAGLDTKFSLLNITDGTLSLYHDGQRAIFRIGKTYDSDGNVVEDIDTVGKLMAKIQQRFSDVYIKLDIGDLSTKYPDLQLSRIIDMHYNQNMSAAEIASALSMNDANAVKDVEKVINANFLNGFFTVYSNTGAQVEVGATTDTSNFASITGIAKNERGLFESARELYCVNNESVVTNEGLFRRGKVTEGIFTVGEAIITIGSSTTLSDIVSQINSNDKSNATAYWDNIKGELVIQSKTTGASFVNIEAGTSDMDYLAAHPGVQASNFTDIMGYTTSTRNADGSIRLQADGSVYNTKMNTNVQKLGDNAKFKINGTSYTSTSNEINSDVSRINGVTINLKGTSAGEVQTLTVEKDVETVSNAVSEVIDAYNELMENVDKAIEKGGSLATDSTLKMIRNQLKNLMTSSVAGSTVFKNLDAIGIGVAEATGTNIDTSNKAIVAMKFDASKFAKAFRQDQSALKSLLVGTGDNMGTGVFDKLENIIEQALGSSGYFSSTEKSYTKQITRLNEKITKATRSVETYKAQLEARFKAMDMLISKMNQQYSSFLN